MVENRPLVSLKRVSFSHSASCTHGQACNVSSVVLIEVGTVDLHASEWYGPQAVTTPDMEGIEKAAEATALLIRGAQSVRILGCSWSAVTSGRGAPLRIAQDMLKSPVLKTLSIENTSFQHNFVPYGHGAIAIDSFQPDGRTIVVPLSTHYSITECLFKNNTGMTGGGLWWRDVRFWLQSEISCFLCSEGTTPTVALTHCTFSDNAVSEYGGAIAVDGISLVLDNCVLTGNDAGLAGGAIAVVNASITARACTINHNHVTFNRTVSEAQPQHRIEQPLLPFIGGGSVAAAHCNQPGVYIHGSSIMDSTAICESGVGGGVAVHDCYGSLQYSSLLHNQAAEQGGAVYISQSPMLLMQSVRLSGNRAGQSGGALAAVYASVTLETSTCSNNHVLEDPAANGTIPSPYDRVGVGGCAAVLEGSVLQTKAFVVAGNRATQGGGIHTHCGGDSIFWNATFVNNTATAFGSAISFECPSVWLDFTALHKARVILPSEELQVLGSGPVALNVISSIAAIFEGYLDREVNVLVLELVDVNGERVTTESSAVCEVTANEPGNPSARPGLLAPPVYGAQGGIIRIGPFGFTARGINVVGITVTCNDAEALTAYVEIPVASLHPNWLQPPPRQWVPSSGPALIPMEPTPSISLHMIPWKPHLLVGVGVGCTASAQSSLSGRIVSLLNPPVNGYWNDKGNWSVIELPGLHIDAPYGEDITLSLRCFRDHEELPLLSTLVKLRGPSLTWWQNPPVVILSGVPFVMAVALLPPSSPEANATSCTAVVFGSGWEASKPFVRQSVAVMRHGVAVWRDIVVTGELGTRVLLQVNCSAGFHTLPGTLVASVRISYCPPGTEPGPSSTSCVGCTGATYSRGGMEPCRECPPVGAWCRKGDLILQEGFYPASTAYLWTSNAVEAEGARATNPPMARDTVLYPCDVPTACLIANSSYGDYHCGHGHDGPLCAACSEGYFKTGLHCSECWSPWVSILAITALILLTLSALSYITLFRKSSKPSTWKIIFRIMLSFIQMLSSLGQFRAKATEIVQQALGITDAVGNSVFGLGPIQCTFSLDYYDRFLLSLLLPFIVGVFVTILATSVIVVGHFGNCRRLLRLSLFQLSRWSQVPRHQPRGGASSSSPRSCLGQRWAHVKRDVSQYFRAKAFIGPTLFVYFLFYNGIINTLSAIFRCREERIDAVQFLEVDANVPCYDGPHVAGMVASVLLALILNVVFPLLLVIILRRNRRQLHSPEVQSRYGFLYMGYSVTRGLYWWEAVVLLRKFSILMVASSIHDAFFQSLVGVTVIVVFLVIQVNFKPYDNPLLNRLELLVMACLCTTQIVSLSYFRFTTAADASGAITPSASSGIQAVVTIILFIVNGSCLCLLAVFLILSLYRKRRHKARLKKQHGIVHGSKFAAVAMARPTEARPIELPSGPFLPNDRSLSSSRMASRLLDIRETSRIARESREREQSGVILSIPYALKPKPPR